MALLLSTSPSANSSSILEVPKDKATAADNEDIIMTEPMPDKVNPTANPTIEPKLKKPKQDPITQLADEVIRMINDIKEDPYIMDNYPPSDNDWEPETAEPM